MDRIVAEAQVTRAGIHSHFPSKETLVVACLNQAARAMRDHARPLGGKSAEPVPHPDRGSTPLPLPLAMPAMRWSWRSTASTMLTIRRA
ncbi:helix-turn-helix domain-containing protein [Streptomyces sp900116325]|uniref:TetR/AcrR family transcriptional regulator n=1 Tax=Streptomyces sp. 900116325 TaxID=3154295 RepID=UPI0033BA9CCC